MKITMIIAVACFTFAKPALAECQPDRNGNIIDFGNGNCQNFTDHLPNDNSQTVRNTGSIETLISNLSEIPNFGDFFEYYRNVVYPVYSRFYSRLTQDFLNTPSVVADPEWIASRERFELAEASLVITLDRYTCTQRGLVDKFSYAGEILSLYESSFISLLFRLEGSTRRIETYIDQGNLNILSRYLEEDFQPLVNVTELKLRCLADHENLTARDLREASNLFSERLRKASQLLETVY